MNISNLVSSIHWIPVIVLTLFSFVLGTIWHLPFLFGKIWAKENNITNDQAKTNLTLTFGVTAIAHFLAISGLSAVVSGMGGLFGLRWGLFVSIIWVLPALAGTYLFAKRSLKLLAIDAGLYIVLFSVAGFILGIWS